MDIQEKIEAYFTGNLSEAEMRDLEATVNNDPELRKDFELQADISEAIKELRIAELKAQLESIPITTSIFESTLFKTIASVVVITGASIVGYLLLSDKTESVTPAIQEMIADSTESTEPAVEQMDQPVEQETKTIEKPQQEEKSGRTITPKPVVPDVIEEFADEETREEISIPENEILENTPEVETGIGIEVKSGTEYDFHYKFLNDRLFLYGNFSDELYDILEIKSDTSSQLFFSYKDKFYQLDRNQTEITPLQEITNRELLEKLKSIKDNN